MGFWENGSFGKWAFGNKKVFENGKSYFYVCPSFFFLIVSNLLGKWDFGKRDLDKWNFGIWAFGKLALWEFWENGSLGKWVWEMGFW